MLNNFPAWGEWCSLNKQQIHAFIFMFFFFYCRVLYRITWVFWSFLLLSAQYATNLFLLCSKIWSSLFYFEKHTNNHFLCSKQLSRYGSFWVICVQSIASNCLTSYCAAFHFYYFFHSCLILPSCPICLVGHLSLYRIGYTGSSHWPVVKLN